MAAIKQLVHSLHSSLGIAEFQYQHHKKLVARREEIVEKLSEMKMLKEKIDRDSIAYSNMLHMFCISGMMTLWGVMARLTWWEYSWDVIEPCTYFVTYGGCILMYSFYLATKTLR